MNNRDYKRFAQGEFYHLYNRGNGKMNVFLDDEDYRFFLRRLRGALMPDFLAPRERERMTKLPVGAFDIVCLCLMPNHFHLLVRQNLEIPASKLLIKVCTSYSKFFNKKYDRVGSLFQDQFKAVHVETNEQLLWLSAYIHKNPLEAGLVRNLETYEYSSYKDYIGKRSDPLYKKEIIYSQLGQGEAYVKSMLGLEMENSSLISYQNLAIDGLD